MFFEFSSSYNGITAFGKTEKIAMTITNEAYENEIYAREEIERARLEAEEAALEEERRRVEEERLRIEEENRLAEIERLR